MITKHKSTPKFLQNGGEMGQIIMSKNWSSHPLGPPEMWPLSLKFAIGSMLKTAFPNFIFWGKDFRCFYNDAYRPSLGREGKHPSILGQKGKEAWPEIWETIEPLLNQVWTTGKATWSENQLIPFYRNGQIEDIYWTFSYSALMGDDEKIGGILTTCTETTESVLNLQRLEESEENLRFAIDAAELGTWDYNPKTDSFLANERLQAWLGVDGENEIELQKTIEAIKEEDRERVADSIENVLLGANEGKFDQTYSIQNLTTKEIRVVRSLGRAWFDKAGAAYRFNGTTQDVTEQVEANKDLRRANDLIRKEERRFRDIVHNAPVGIAIFVTTDLIVEMANLALLQVVDRTYSNFVGKKLYDAIPEIKGVVGHLFKEISDKKEPVKGTEFKIPIKRKGSIQEAYFDFILHPIRIENGSVMEIMLVVNEVSDYVISRDILAENEIQFKNLILQSPVAKAIFRGPDLIVEMANYQMLDYFWGRNWEMVVGEKLIDALPELKGQQFISELKNVLRTGQISRKSDFKTEIKKDGEKTEFYIDFVGLPLKEVDGSVTGIMVTASDVTEKFQAKEKLIHFSKQLELQVKERTEMLRKANEKLMHSVKKLEGANAELESFAYVSSHDLQEPLRKIQMFISRFEEQESDDLSESGKKYFAKISDSARRMRVLINDLLGFSRTEEDKTKFETTDLNYILRQVLDDYTSQIEHIRAKISTAEMPTVHAIPFQMRQVFSNLIGNALKFSADNDHPKIEIAIDIVEGKSLEKIGLKRTTAYHKISVKDNGIGFSSGMEDKIFEVFQRLHGKQEYEGTGIGLAIVKKIMHNHDGAVTASSKQNEGATFSMYLPRLK